MHGSSVECHTSTYGLHTCQIKPICSIDVTIAMLLGNGTVKYGLQTGNKRKNKESKDRLKGTIPILPFRKGAILFYHHRLVVKKVLNTKG